MACVLTVDVCALALLFLCASALLVVCASALLVVCASALLVVCAFALLVVLQCIARCVSFPSVVVCASACFEHQV